MKHYIFSAISLFAATVMTPADSLGCSHVAAAFGASCPVCDAPAAGGFSASYGYAAPMVQSYSQQQYAAPVVQAPVQTFAAPAPVPVQQSTITYQSTASYQAPTVVSAPALVSTYSAPMVYAAPAYSYGVSNFAAPAYGGSFGLGGYGVNRGFSVGIGRGYGGIGFNAFRGAGYGGFNRGFGGGFHHNGFGFAGAGYR